jgi:hypothetical protein
MQLNLVNIIDSLNIIVKGVSCGNSRFVNYGHLFPARDVGMSPNPEKIKNFIYVSISAERHFVIRGKHN